MSNNLPRFDDGTLMSYVFPGGYPVFYIDKENDVLCPVCANKETDQDNMTAEANWEDTDLICCECSARIESAYGDDN